jgi:uncharacterized membrane protein
LKKNGTLIAFLSYVLWGFLPLYWHALAELTAAEILAHRIVWSLVFILGILVITRRWQWFADVRRRPTAYGRYVITAVILAINYAVYLWANNSGHLVEASLGYFINPLINVLLGMVFLRERLRPWQAAAVLVYIPLAELRLESSRPGVQPVAPSRRWARGGRRRSAGTGGSSYELQPAERCPRWLVQPRQAIHRILDMRHRVHAARHGEAGELQIRQASSFPSRSRSVEIVPRSMLRMPEVM